MRKKSAPEFALDVRNRRCRKREGTVRTIKYTTGALTLHSSSFDVAELNDSRVCDAHRSYTLPIAVVGFKRDL